MKKDDIKTKKLSAKKAVEKKSRRTVASKVLVVPKKVIVKKTKSVVKANKTSRVVKTVKPTKIIKSVPINKPSEFVSIRRIFNLFDPAELVINLKINNAVAPENNKFVGRLGSGFIRQFSRSLMRITATGLIIMMNWTWLSAIGGTFAYLNDSEISNNNNFAAGVLDFELTSSADFLPSLLTACGSAERTISIINNNGNLFKYRASSTDFSGKVCDYVRLEANIDGGTTEYVGPLKDFNFGPIDYSDPKEWNFKLTLDPDVPAYLDGQMCNFKFIYHGSQTRHDLSLGKGFNDIEEIASSITASVPQFCTQTQGGWGATCNGNNPACLLANNWNFVIGGDLVVGQGKTITLSSAEAVKNYLPDGSTPAVLDNNYINPTATNAGVLGGQVTALKINVLFSNARLGLIGAGIPYPLGSLTINSGRFAGINVTNFLDLAEKVLGGDSSVLAPYSATISDVSDTAGSINENFDNCTANNGYLTYSECYTPVCGNGIKDAGEQCDDGNLNNGDGCNASCQKECTPATEVCDGLDNDCDGEVDNNIFKSLLASSSPTSAHLDGSCSPIDITNKVKSSDNLRASQSIGRYDPAKYIYLDWQFGTIPHNAIIGTSSFALEHRESDVKITVEWWQASTSNYIEVCDPQESLTDVISHCDLSSYIKTVGQATDVKLRVKIVQNGHCQEDIDWANLSINYKIPTVCAICGNGLLEGDEQCDDGNTVSGDDCDSSCLIEDPSRCIKINEVYYDPDSCHGGKKAEWLELYNVCDYEINLKNWYFIDNGGRSDKEKINQDNILAGHAFALIAADAQIWSHWSVPDTALKIALGGNRLFRGLGNNSDRLFLYNASDNLADAMSYGRNKSAFNPSAPDVARGHSLSRQPAGVDTNTAADWFDTYNSSTPPGPNPGTNPHDANVVLQFPLKADVPCCGDYSLDTADNSDELVVKSDTIIDQPEVLESPASDDAPVASTNIDSGDIVADMPTAAIETEGDRQADNVSEVNPASEIVVTDDPADSEEPAAESPTVVDENQAATLEETPAGATDEDKAPIDEPTPAVIPDPEPEAVPETVATIE